jgi:hypothetical protein
MPARDKTGPFGTGPRGRGRGPCRQADTSSFGGRGQGRGLGQGRRQGQGRKGGGGFFDNGIGHASLTQAEETVMLEKHISALQARLSELQGKSGK